VRSQGACLWTALGALRALRAGGRGPLPWADALKQHGERERQRRPLFGTALQARSRLCRAMQAACSPGSTGLAGSSCSTGSHGAKYGSGRKARGKARACPPVWCFRGRGVILYVLHAQACSSNWLERRSPKPGVGGSSPSRPAINPEVRRVDERRTMTGGARQRAINVR
jgi:hypothetical protein